MQLSRIEGDKIVKENIIELEIMIHYWLQHPITIWWCSEALKMIETIFLKEYNGLFCNSSITS